MAAYDVHRAQLMGRVEPTTGIVPFTALVGQVMARGRTLRPARCTGSRTTAALTAGRPPSTAWPRPGRTRSLVHLPVHASWLNQVEIVFSVIQRKVITPADLGQRALAARLLAFQYRYNTTARPFDWQFTRAKLNKLCRRIDAHRNRGALPLAG